MAPHVNFKEQATPRSLTFHTLTIWCRYFDSATMLITISKSTTFLVHPVEFYKLISMFDSLPWQPQFLTIQQPIRQSTRLCCAKLTFIISKLFTGYYMLILRFRNQNSWALKFVFRQTLSRIHPHSRRKSKRGRLGGGVFLRCFWKFSYKIHVCVRLIYQHRHRNQGLLL